MHHNFAAHKWLTKTGSQLDTERMDLGSLTSMLAEKSSYKIKTLFELFALSCVCARVRVSVCDLFLYLLHKGAQFKISILVTISGSIAMFRFWGVSVVVRNGIDG